MCAYDVRSLLRNVPHHEEVQHTLIGVCIFPKFHEPAATHQREDARASTPVGNGPD